MAAITALLGGPALYLAGNLLFERSSGGRYFPLSHLAGVVLLVLADAAALLWPAPAPVILSLIGTSVLILVAGWEMVSLRETRKGLAG